RTIPMVRDVRFFVNTLQHAVDLMTQKGIAATTTCGKRDGCLEYTVRIPVGEGHPAPVVAPRAGPAQELQTTAPADPDAAAQNAPDAQQRGAHRAPDPAQNAPPAQPETPQPEEAPRPAAVQAAQAVRAAAVQAPPPAEALQAAPLTAAELEALLAPAEAPPQTGDFAVQLL
ncbi:MAG TPA: hypothetical protein H9846_05900, partial [Candidatus Gemmiger excrementipullorum]|nr:hypothetical protein [Candidatus Gemmiger excrementipullorum]